MSNFELPADLRRLILASIPTVPYLEAMLLLREQRRADWDAPQLARRLYVTERAAAELIDLLTQNRVAVAAGAPGRVRYGPEPELGELIDRLANCYSTHLLSVTELIHSRMDRRAQQFGDAFRFRKGTD